MIVHSKELKGYTLHSLDGEIGKVKSFYFDDRYWVVRNLVVDTGTWLNEQKVLIAPHSLSSVDYDNHFIQVNLTKDQIEGSPPLDTDKPVSQQFEEDLYRYYGWPTYWGGEYMWEAFPNPDRDDSIKPGSNEGGKAWDPHLRSTEEVRSYSIQALDGELGHVDDFLLDDEAWAIRYMRVQTNEWLPGKKMLIAPQWIARVSWDESTVFVNLTRAAIESAPEYKEDESLTREYENSLYSHYNNQGYWEMNNKETRDV